MWHKYKYTLGSLVLASTVSVIMVVWRVERTNNWRYFFLIWNLFLAWIPLILSFFIHQKFWHHQKLTLWILGFGLVWLLFYPNAPYIMTDLIHLRARDYIPLWYDMMLILSFAWTGLFAGFVSLYLMQNIVKKLYGRALGWCFVVGVIGLGSFGVYLGRFLRWNSWDIVSSPSDIAGDVVSQMLNPLSNKWSWLFTLVFFGFSLFTYLLLYAFSHLHTEWDRHT